MVKRVGEEVRKSRKGTGRVTRARRGMNGNTGIESKHEENSCLGDDSPERAEKPGVSRKWKPGRTAQAFIESLCGPANGSVTEASRAVGISVSTGYKHSIRWRAEIEQYKNGELAISDVADVQELKRFFTLALRDPDIAFKDRLMAAQTLAKINGLMNDKFEMRTNRREAVRELHELVMRLANSVKPSNSKS